MSEDHGLQSSHLRTNLDGDHAPSTNAPTAETLAICAALARQGGCSADRLGIELSVPPWVAQAYLRILWRRGFLKRASWPRNTYYVTPWGLQQLGREAI